MRYSRRAEGLPSVFDQPPPNTPAKGRHRRVSESALDAHDALGPDRATKTARILELIRSAGTRGKTLQEISADLGIPINSVCGCVGALLNEYGLIFKPLRGAAGPDRDPVTNKPLKKNRHVLREGREILVAIEYLDHYPESKSEAA